MTREEEIKEASINYTRKNRLNVFAEDEYSLVMREYDRNKAFEEGAKWADSNPKENLIDIEKACNWLKDRISIPYEVNTNENGEPFAGDYITFAKERLKMAEEFCKEFKNAMKQ